jgi:hypothetical protein
MDTATKYENQMSAKRSALTDSATLSDRAAGRNLAYAQLKSGWKMRVVKPLTSIISVN